MMAGVSTQVDVGNPNDRDWRYLSALISMDGTPDAISRQFALHESNYAFFKLTVVLAAVATVAVDGGSLIPSLSEAQKCSELEPKVHSLGNCYY